MLTVLAISVSSFLVSTTIGSSFSMLNLLH
jgi:hypothetical protein